MMQSILLFIFAFILLFPGLNMNTPGIILEPDIQGEIKNISLSTTQSTIIATILIEADQPRNSKFDKAFVLINTNTKIYWLLGEEKQSTNIKSLRTGDRVQVWFTGPIQESYPIKALSSQIVILGSGGVSAPDAEKIEKPELKIENEAPPMKEESITATKQKTVPYPVTLRQVRAGTHKGYDRVVFEFEGNKLPDYKIEYLSEAERQCGSGDVMKVGGNSWLRVRFAPAYAHTESGTPTVKKREQHFKFKILRELKLACDFEAEVIWVIGIASKRDYKLLNLRNPTRVVIDIKH